MAIGNFRRVFGEVRPVIGMVHLGLGPPLRFTMRTRDSTGS